MVSSLWCAAPASQHGNRPRSDLKLVAAPPYGETVNLTYAAFTKFSPVVAACSGWKTPSLAPGSYLMRSRCDFCTAVSRAVQLEALMYIEGHKCHTQLSRRLECPILKCSPSLGPAVQEHALSSNISRGCVHVRAFGCSRSSHPPHRCDWGCMEPRRSLTAAHQFVDDALPTRIRGS